MNIVKNIKNIAQEVLLNESRAIENPAKPFGNDFEECVKEIYSSKWRIAITGIGKSVIIANKIMTSLNSAGMSVRLLNAAPYCYVHGGVFQHNHLVGCITKSDNTFALKVLRPMYERWQSKLVALTGRANFRLNERKSDARRQCDFIQENY
ncbi:MAG: hypothetical protein KF803_16845 [Cyclobacteriaceae bacterium]|nr:hypothetical protein [Cyclobacteriaceae bacterium]